MLDNSCNITANKPLTTLLEDIIKHEHEEK